MTLLRTLDLMSAVGLTAFICPYMATRLLTPWLRTKNRCEISAEFGLWVMMLIGAYSLRSEIQAFFKPWDRGVVLILTISIVGWGTYLRRKNAAFFDPYSLLLGLEQTFRGGRNRSSPKVLVLVVYTDYTGRVYADQIVAALIEYGGFTAKTSSMVFVSYDLLRGFASDFKEWVASEADALLAVRGEDIRGVVESELIGAEVIRRQKGKIYLIDVEPTLGAPPRYSSPLTRIPEQPFPSGCPGA